jgi:hypothetical protein
VNQIIELHDSQLASIKFVAGQAVVLFSHAYVYRSLGEPGKDPGSGWSQRAELSFRESPEVRLPESWPCNITDGRLRLGDAVYDNHIPIPLNHQGNVALELELIDCDGEFTVIELTGNYPRLKLLGEAQYVEEFSGVS